MDNEQPDRRDADTVDDDGRDLDRMKVDELRERAKQLGMHGVSHLRKAELIEALGGAAGSGRGTDDAMTRSEERLTVDTERQEVGRARLRKYVVTEEVQVTVPIRREEVRLEREPVTGDNRRAAESGPDISEAEYEITLYEERPVVTTETVPVERVRLSKHVVTEEETVGGEVRKERIEADLPGEDRQQLA